MKKIGIIWRILSCLTTAMYLVVCVSATQITTEPQQTPGTDININVSESLGIDATTTLLGADKLVDNAQSAVLYEANSGSLMYAWKADAKMYPASLVKILTALIAVEEGTLSDIVTVSSGAVDSVPLGAVSSELIAGEQISLEDLIYCMMVGSANDAAAVIAEHIGGSQAAFVQKMNDYAKTLGCLNTQFINPHGLHDEEQFTTARDITRILAAAAENEQFLEVFTTREYTVEATNKSDIRTMVTGNYLVDTSSKLYYDERVLGGRTGVTEDGRRCLASVSEHNGMLLICVVMGAESEYQEDGYSAISIGGYKETTALLNAGSSGFKTAQILYANQALCQRTVINGDCSVVMGPRTSVITILPESVSLSDLTFKYNDLQIQAPIALGQKVSIVQVWNGNICVAQEDLYALNSVDIVGGLQVLEGSGNDNAVIKTVLIIMVSVVACVFVITLLIRGVRKFRQVVADKRKNRYHRSHRRSR